MVPSHESKPSGVSVLQQRTREAIESLARRTPDRYGEIVDAVRQKLINLIDKQTLDSYGKDPNADRTILQYVQQLIQTEAPNTSLPEQMEMVNTVLADLFGYGPLEEFVKDPTVSEIMVNGPNQVWIEREGKLILTDKRFRNKESLYNLIDRIVQNVGRRIDESNPIADARLPDGSRVNAVLTPVALDGPYLTIRKFGKQLSIDELIQKGSLDEQIADILQRFVRARFNIIVSGGTGSGKTTMLNALSSFIPHDERIVTIEDSAELQLQQPHVVRHETKPPNVEGKGEITIRMLVKNALRQRPDRIVVGEVRDGAALDMLQAMNTGHDGSLTTIHANSPQDLMNRLEALVLQAGYDMPSRAIRQQISSAVDIVVQVERLRDGSRKVVSISQVGGLDEDGNIIVEDLIRFKYEGEGPVEQVDPVTKETRVVHRIFGRHVPTGVRLFPYLANKLIIHGVEVPEILAPQE